jgi:hypothetical protein
VSEPNSKTFRQRLWDIVENPLGQTAVGLVLLALGTLLSSKSAMLLAFAVFLLAAYRAKLFHHAERYKRILSYIFVPTGLALILATLWFGAWKIKGQNTSEVQSTATFANDRVPQSISPQSSVTETSGTTDRIKVEVHHAPKDTASAKVGHSLPPSASVSSSGNESPAIGSITQGTGSALSINQSGGVTAGQIGPIFVTPQSPPPHVTFSQEPLASGVNLGTIIPATTIATGTEEERRNEAARVARFANNPGVLVTMTPDDSWASASFAASCNRPCEAISAMTTNTGGSSAGEESHDETTVLVQFVQPSTQRFQQAQSSNGKFARKTVNPYLLRKLGL